MSDIKPKNSKKTTFAFTVSCKKGHVTLEDLKRTFKAYCVSKKKDIVNIAVAYELGKNEDHPHIHVLVEYKRAKRIGNLRSSLEKWWSKVLDHAITPNFIGKRGCKIAHSPHYFISTYMQKEGIEFINSGFDIKSLKKNATTLSRKTYYLGKSRIPIHKNNFLDLYQEILTTTDFPQLYEWDGHDINYYINALTQYLHSRNYQVSYMLDNKKRLWDRILFAHKCEIEFMPDA